MINKPLTEQQRITADLNVITMLMNKLTRFHGVECTFIARRNNRTMVIANDQILSRLKDRRD